MRLSSWLTIITIAEPATYPSSNGRDRKRVTNPSPITPASSIQAPVMSASPPVSATKRAGSPAAIGATTDAVRRATVASGPTFMLRTPPSRM